ncbi:MAG: hypothetical protein Q4G06_00380 [Clostridia bacterium]|nr:hypothetical protein [Clostridia bacterium]
MPLFDSSAEKLRKENLKSLEDRRLHFAEELQQRGFKPEKMLFCSTEGGQFVALARCDGKIAVVVSPIFGQEGDFLFECHDALQWEKEDIFEKGTGLNGAFGFGKKGAKGFILHIMLSDGSVAHLHVVAGRTSYLETDYKHNPLLKTKRRRGDANIIWDLVPIEPGHLDKIEDVLFNYYLT